MFAVSFAAAAAAIAGGNAFAFLAPTYQSFNTNKRVKNSGKCHRFKSESMHAAASSYSFIR